MATSAKDANPPRTLLALAVVLLGPDWVCGGYSEMLDFVISGEEYSCGSSTFAAAMERVAPILSPIQSVLQNC